MDQERRNLPEQPVYAPDGLIKPPSGGRQMLSRLAILGSLFSFMTEGSRKFWLLPLFLALLLVTVFVIVGVAAGPLAPIIYTMF
ncbi:MAG: hypothetical protein H0U76_30890 [Ktedonobacteraceae bacterium]|nr:hypothetical protein [Ktedonobacteraceae bacterium]